jgi:hypothetical protein
MNLRLPAIAALLLISACAAQPQKPIQFPIQSGKAEALPNIRAALAERGHETERMDEEAGVIYTRWVDTGFMYGEIQGATATIVRRYAVILTTAPDGTGKLTLRADTKRCAQDGFEIGDMMVTGTCEGMNGLVSQHQQELDALGAELQSRIN